MALRNWPLHRVVLVWIAFVLVALLLMLAGTVLDASGSETAGLFTFFLASICVAAPLLLTWHWRQDRKK